MKISESYVFLLNLYYHNFNAVSIVIIMNIILKCVSVYVSIHISKQNVHVIDASALLAYVYLYMSVLPLWRS